MEGENIDSKNQESFTERDQFITNIVAEILENQKNLELQEPQTHGVSLKNGGNEEHKELIPFSVTKDKDKYDEDANCSNLAQIKDVRSISPQEFNNMPVENSEESDEVNDEINGESENVQEEVDLEMEIEECYSEHEDSPTETLENSELINDNDKIQFLQQMDTFFTQVAKNTNSLDDDQEDEHVTAYSPVSLESKPPSRFSNNNKKSSFRCTKCKKSFKLRILLNKHRCVKKTTTKTEKQKETKTDNQYLKVNGSTVRYFNGLYFCSVCDKSFSNKGSVRRHMKYHTGNVHACASCQKVFSCASELLKHSRVHTNERPYTCDICEKSFKNSSHLNSHKLLHFDSKQHQCSECDKSFARKESLVRHMKYHTGDVLLCPDCGKSFASQGELRMHRFTHGNDRPFVCEICGSRFKRNTNYRSHKRTHMKKENYSCSVCEKTFGHMSSLRRHMKYHIGNTFSCNACNKQFSCNSEYQKHRTVHTNERQYQCETCSKSFKLASHLKAHHKVHTGSGAEYVCKDCGKKFLYKASLVRHQKQFCFLKNNTCSICEQKFEQVDCLIGHFEEHTYDELTKLFGKSSAMMENYTTKKEILEQLKKVLTMNGEESDNSSDNSKTETYQCDLCQKTFQHRDSLKRHQRFHEGKYVTCDICGKHCSCVSELNKHKVIHCHEEPFECDVCQKKIKTLDRLKIHKLNSHIPQVCEEQSCGKSFQGRSSLRRHQKRCHSNKASKSTDSSFEVSSRIGKKDQPESSDDSELESDSVDEVDKDESENTDECVTDSSSDSDSEENVADPEVEEKLRRSPGKSGHKEPECQESAFHCQYCKKAFWESSFLENHIKTKHSNSECK